MLRYIVFIVKYRERRGIACTVVSLCKGNINLNLELLDNKSDFKNMELVTEEMTEL